MSSGGKEFTWGGKENELSEKQEGKYYVVNQSQGFTCKEPWFFSVKV